MGGFPGDDIPFITGSALSALEAMKDKPDTKKGDNEWVDKVLTLMETVDEYIALRERATDKPFLLAVEDVFSIAGRGTMATSEGTEVQMGMPGDDVTIDCELIATTPIEVGMRFAMREGGKTIGQGLITETQ